MNTLSHIFYLLRWENQSQICQVFIREHFPHVTCGHLVKAEPVVAHWSRPSTDWHRNACRNCHKTLKEEMTKKPRLTQLIFLK